MKITLKLNVYPAFLTHIYLQRQRQHILRMEVKLDAPVNSLHTILV